MPSAYRSWLRMPRWRVPAGARRHHAPWRPSICVCHTSTKVIYWTAVARLFH
jgi:hypothetical protein